MADAVLLTKEDTAEPGHIQQVEAAVQRLNPRATLLHATSPLQIQQPELISGKRVLVVEDGPTLTHGGMLYGAATIAAERYGAAALVDPRPYAQGSLAAMLQAYPALTRVLPALGYGSQQLRELQETINATPCDVVLFGTPVDLRRLLSLRHPAVRVRYEVRERGPLTLADILPDPLVKRRVFRAPGVSPQT